MSEQQPSAVARYASGLSETGTGEESGPEEYRAFGHTSENSSGQSVMLELRWKDGRRKAIGYSYLVGVDFDNSSEIRLEFVGHRITVIGRRMAELFRRLVAHRVSFIQEIDPLHAAEFPDDRPVVTEIRVENE